MKNTKVLNLNIYKYYRKQKKKEKRFIYKFLQKGRNQLINRLVKYCRNHLLFLKKFFVPFSNNRAESDLRGIKIKQKTGKFRSIEGANIYAVIKSCISTYKKNDINPYKALKSIFSDNPILI